MKRKITSETGSTVKTSIGSIYRKSDIAEAKLNLQPELTQSSIKSPYAEPRKKLEKISSLERLEENDSDEQVQSQAQQADVLYPTESFQQSHTIAISKDTEAGGFSTLPSSGLNQTKGDRDCHADQKSKKRLF